MIKKENNNVIKTIPEAEELGFVGIPNEINNEQILNIINQNKIPIISPLGFLTAVENAPGTLIITPSITACPPTRIFGFIVNNINIRFIKK